MLSLYRPPPYLAACSQGVWSGDGGPMLVRNYDYAPSRMEGIIWSTRLRERRVIGMSDCLWGLLDGMNDAGLAVSLTFGGRRVLGDGFGIPLVVRYLPGDVRRRRVGREPLARLPYALAPQPDAWSMRAGEVLTAYLSPDREPFFRNVPAATNHQGIVEWPEQARATRTIERERCILDLLDDPDDDRCVVRGVRSCASPLFSTAYDSGFGTLYTAAYRPARGTVDYRWPAHVMALVGFDGFVEAEHAEVLAERDRSRSDASDAHFRMGVHRRWSGGTLRRDRRGASSMENDCDRASLRSTARLIDRASSAASRSRSARSRTGRP